MSERLRRGARIGAAASLALVTLGVFTSLRDYGPESAVRRFHRAALTGDVRELQSVTLEPVESAAPLELYRWVRYMNRLGARYRLLRMERSPEKVYAAIEYVLPNGEPYATVWVVVKPRHTENWKIDATQTRTIVREGLVGVPR